LQLVSGAGFGVVEHNIGLDELGPATHHFQIGVAIRFVRVRHCDWASIFSTEVARQRQWSSFLTRGQITDAPATLLDVIEVLRRFLQPVTVALIEERHFVQRWLPGGPWQSSHAS